MAPEDADDDLTVQVKIAKDLSSQNRQAKYVTASSTWFPVKKLFFMGFDGLSVIPLWVLHSARWIYFPSLGLFWFLLITLLNVYDQTLVF